MNPIWRKLLSYQAKLLFLGTGKIIAVSALKHKQCPQYTYLIFSREEGGGNLEFPFERISGKTYYVTI